MLTEQGRALTHLPAGSRGGVPFCPLISVTSPVSRFDILQRFSIMSAWIQILLMAQSSKANMIVFLSPQT